jgi:hypothetical protein
MLDGHAKHGYVRAHGQAQEAAARGKQLPRSLRSQRFPSTGDRSLRKTAQRDRKKSSKGALVQKKEKTMKQGYIEKRKDGHLVRWREDDALTGKRKQVSKVVKGDYGAALAFLQENSSHRELRNP